MKFFRMLILLFCLMLSGCQQLLTVPLAFAQSMLPVLIQYAPLALMFLEETQDGNHYAEQQKFQAYIQQKLQEHPEDLENVNQVLQSYLEDNKQWKGVFVVPLQTAEDQKRLMELYGELSQKGKVHYAVTSYDPQNNEIDTVLENLDVPVWVESGELHENIE